MSDLNETEELVHIDTPILQEEVEEQEDWTREDEDRFNGDAAGVAFAQRHVVDKINLFIEEYRRNKYSEEFIEGFLQGINDSLGSNIGHHDEESTESVDSTE